MSERPTSRRGRALKLLGLSALLLALGACIFLPDFAGQRKAGKYEPVEQAAVPVDRAAMPVAESQTEPHTCGLHAMRSLYAAYGLDPEAFRLRFRLGTDQPAMRADKDSTGTLHPDLYRVLAQDGFLAEPIDLDDGDATDQLDQHLQTGQLALAVVYRSTYHWVLLAAGARPGRWVVIDSLAAEPAVVSAESFLTEALSITRVAPAGPDERQDTADAHAAGLAEMARLYRRR